MSSHRSVPPPRSHRAPRKPRVRIAVTGAAALAVVSGGTAFACMGHTDHHHAEAAASGHTHLVPAQWLSQTGSPWTHGGHGSRPTASPSASATPTASASTRPTPTAEPTASRPTPTASPAAAPTHRPTPTPTATAAPTSSAPSSGADLAVQRVLDLINQARAQQGLPALTLLDGLNSSAAQHNAVMASGCGLSHQCPGEPAFGDRESANGVHWRSAGENIGVGGPVADTPEAIASMAVHLTQGMLDEQPPDDGHRRNILSSGYTRIGIAVFRDSSGSVWLTQDFAQLQ
ncbi:CAP domain-containing protein [Actinacidiphila sp. DG2A-62]|uniref:CAP domain-containing protein n=1 Tax=Actinacidiphila sp. DG2A-62 TaxID=3108821 RepID=UPI002DBA431D|nr:CAP domain-containing protein [Actinacidiphila sp. DG2A-62]MEC3992397.1 CAP domain-containing protein [Actinacidiphila sp. DG2A-62]